MDGEDFRTLVDQLRAVLAKGESGGLKQEWPLPAREEDIEAWERRTGEPMSPSYRALLLIQDGWRDYAYGFSIVGASSARFEAANRDIGETVGIERDEWRQAFGEDTSEAIARYENGGSNLNPLEADWLPYVPEKICFGTDFNGGLLFFEPARRNDRGEMPVFRWYAGTGTQARFDSFADMLRADLAALKAQDGA
jgi:SMI1 / KNR4 family (SUKH-1)